LRIDGAGGKGAFGGKELLQMVVATEVFDLFGETGKKLRGIAMAVAKKWEGGDQAASGLLITFLEKNVPSATSFLASPSFQTCPRQSCNASVLHCIHLSPTGVPWGKGGVPCKILWMMRIANFNSDRVKEIKAGIRSLLVPVSQ